MRAIRTYNIHSVQDETEGPAFNVKGTLVQPTGMCYRASLGPDENINPTVGMYISVSAFFGGD